MFSLSGCEMRKVPRKERGSASARDLAARMCSSTGASVTACCITAVRLCCGRFKANTYQTECHIPSRYLDLRGRRTHVYSCLYKSGWIDDPYIHLDVAGFRFDFDVLTGRKAVCCYELSGQLERSIECERFHDLVMLRLRIACDSDPVAALEIVGNGTCWNVRKLVGVWAVRVGRRVGLRRMSTSVPISPLPKAKESILYLCLIDIFSHLQLWRWGFTVHDHDYGVESESYAFVWSHGAQSDSILQRLEGPLTEAAQCC